jgi:hypothetical protein
MKAFKKYIGVIIELIGVAFLIIPKLMESTTNGTLVVGGTGIVVGVITYVITNKKAK